MIARLEHRSWLVVEREEPDQVSCSAQELLEGSRALPGTLRYTRRGRDVVLMGEHRSAPPTPSSEVMNRLLQNAASEEIPAAEQIESVLEASGLEWARREGAWAVV